MAEKHDVSCMEAWKKGRGMPLSPVSVSASVEVDGFAAV